MDRKVEKWTAGTSDKSDEASTTVSEQLTMHCGNLSGVAKRQTIMKYNKQQAKAYAKDTMTGIWAAALNPFNQDGSLNERGLRKNIRHWIDELDISG